MNEQNGQTIPNQDPNMNNLNNNQVPAAASFNVPNGYVDMNNQSVAPTTETQENVGTINNIPNQNQGMDTQNINNPMGGQTLGEAINQPIQPGVSSMNNQVPAGGMPQGTVTPPPTTPNEMDNSFVEPKKKPIAAIVIIILLLLIVGAGAYYYFVMDNPKTIFTTVVNNALSKVNFDSSNRKAIDYTLGVNLTSEDEETQSILDVINQIRLEGIIGNKDDTNIANGMVSYKGNKLVDYNLQINSGNSPAIYAKVEEIYDKVIKINIDEEELADYDVNTEDYEQVISSLKTAILSSLETANYKKEITKIDNERVKKLTLSVDESFLVNIYNKLLQDSNFMESYAKVMGTDTEDVSDMLNEAITDAKGNDETISLYLTLLKNEFIKFEYAGGEDGLSVTKDNNQYNFDISESYTSKYQGYIKFNEVSDRKVIIAVIHMIDDDMTVELNTTYKETEMPEVLDITDAVNFEELTDEELLDILTKVSENENITELLNDLGLNETDTETESSDI